MVVLTLPAWPTAVEYVTFFLSAIFFLIGIFFVVWNSTAAISAASGASPAAD
jgi:preprotein translocase subunit SecG